VITSSAGAALMIFLAIFMQGIILGAKIDPGDAEILSRLWVAGVIPVFVGLALIFNGVVVSKKMLEAAKQSGRSTSELPGAETEPRSLQPAKTTQFVPANFSVTEDTTQHLSHKKESL
jgi:hypothetical protein